MRYRESCNIYPVYLSGWSTQLCLLHNAKSSPSQGAHFKFMAQRDFNHLWHSVLKAFQTFIQSSITESTQQIAI